jgi:secretion/DNA translocation related TadE-like protein
VSRRSEQGLAAPVLVGLTAVLAFVTMAGAVVGRVVVEQRRAAAAADLAALAGATAVQQGSEGCVAAARSATANGARLAACVRAGDEIDVVVAVPARLVGRSVEVTARARAGPITGPVTGPAP